MERQSMLCEPMTVAKDGERSTSRSLPPPLAEGVVRATTALSRALSVEPPYE
jgi:hypothetical protein